MPEVKERPIFRIIENPAPLNIDYDEFLEDFKNPYMTIDEIREKYGFTNSTWRDYRSRALKDLGLSRKPCYTYGKLTYILYGMDTSYIQKKSNGFIIVKKFGNKPKYFGRYEDYGIAKMVRDKLVECHWNHDVGIYLKEKYGINKKKLPSLETAKELYDEFKELYFHSEKGMVEILEEYHITQRTYKYLIEMIRDETGVMYRPSLNQRRIQ